MLASAFGPVDWSAVFVPDTPLVEIFVRGTVVYLALFTLLRVVLKRQSSGVSVTDVLVLVLIADAAQNAMAADYKSVPGGVFLVATIIFWSYCIDLACYHSPWVDRLVNPDALELVRDGKMLRHNMRHELITARDLLSQLRELGVQNLAEVRSARMEADGRLSVFKRGGGDGPQPPRTRPGVGA